MSGIRRFHTRPVVTINPAKIKELLVAHIERFLGMNEATDCNHPEFSPGESCFSKQPLPTAYQYRYNGNNITHYQVSTYRHQDETFFAVTVFSKDGIPVYESTFKLGLRKVSENIDLNEEPQEDETSKSDEAFLDGPLDDDDDDDEDLEDYEDDTD